MAKLTSSGASYRGFVLHNMTGHILGWSLKFVPMGCEKSQSREVVTVIYKRYLDICTLQNI